MTILQLLKCYKTLCLCNWSPTGQTQVHKPKPAQALTDTHFLGMFMPHCPVTKGPMGTMRSNAIAITTPYTVYL